MSKTKSNTESSNKPLPKTQAEFYEHAWLTLLNKLSKEERVQFDTDLAGGKTSTLVNRFVKNVAQLGEEMYEKSKVVSKPAN
jgi:hypothetical protein